MAPSRSRHGSSIGQQVQALFLKDWALERRSWLSALGRTLLPLVLLAILLIVQYMVDQELSGRDYRCGCMCTQCCEWTATAQGTQEYQCYNATNDRPCPVQADCKVYDDSVCGPTYSSDKQIAFCPVPVPPTWPAMLQVPLSRYRAPAPPTSNTTTTATAATTTMGPTQPAGGVGRGLLAAPTTSTAVPDTGVWLEINSTGQPVLVLYTGRDRALASQLSEAMFKDDRGLGARLIQAALNSPELSGGNLAAGLAARTDLCALTPPGVTPVGSGSVTSSGGGTGTGPRNSTTLTALLQSLNATDADSSALPSNATAVADLTQRLSDFLANNTMLLGTPTDTTFTLLLEPGFLAGADEFGYSAQSASTQSSGMGFGGGGGGSERSQSTASGGSAGALNGAWVAGGGDRVLPLYLMSRDCTALLTPGGTDSTTLRQLSCGLRAALGVPIVCTTVVPQWQDSEVLIRQHLYCGWWGSGCRQPTAPNSQLPQPPADTQPPPSTSVGRRLLAPSAAAPATSQGSRAATGSQAAAVSTAAPAPASGQPATATSTSSTVSQATATSVSVQAAPPPTQTANPAGSVATTAQRATPATVAGLTASSNGNSNSNTNPHDLRQYPSLTVDWGSTAVGVVVPGNRVVGRRLDATVWVNSTNLQAGLSPGVQRWPAALNRVSSAYLTVAWQATADRTVSTASQPPQLFLGGVRGSPTPGGPLSLDLAALLGPLFIMWVLMLPLPILVAAWTSERVGGQRALLLRQGATHTALSAATYLWWLLMYTLYTLVFVVFGIICGLSFFTKTSAGVQILLYVVWFHAMYALAAWMSVFYEEVQSGVLAAVAITIFTGLVANLVVVQFVQSGPQWLALLLEAIAPPFALFRALWEACQYAFLANSMSGSGLTLAIDRADGGGFATALAFLCAHTVIGCWCAYYWDQVFGSGDLSGPRKHPFFPMGFQLAPEDPRGWDWFTAQAALARSRATGRLQALRQRWQRRRHAPALSPAAAVEATDTALSEDNSTDGQIVAVANGDSNSSGQSPGNTGSTQHLDTHAVPVAPKAGPGSAVAGLGQALGQAQSTGAAGADVVAERVRVEQIWSSLHADKFMGRVAALDPAAPDVLDGAGRDLGDCHRRCCLPQGWRGCWRRSGRSALAGRGTADSDTDSARTASSADTVSEAPGAPAILLRGVRRVFNLPSNSGGGSSGDVSPGSGTGTRQHVAVSGLWLSVEQGELFGLLGPNGAGKTTCLRMMQGLLEPTAGSVLLCGWDVAREPQVTATLAGICPQHDVLWKSLSAEEHLYCYGRLRGLRGTALREAVQEQLRLLGLTGEDPQQAAVDQAKQGVSVHGQQPTQPATSDGIPPGNRGQKTRVSHRHSLLATKPVGAFSGGMRRRLAVGIALLGAPPCVFLDEPSAGIDPASRAALWRAIRTTKATGRTSIVLTTHSMQEAESLCDRLGVFVAGQLRCVGSAQELASRFSHSLLLSITVPASQSQLLQDKVASLPGCEGGKARLVSSAGGAHRWEVDKQRVPLAQLYCEVQRLVVEQQDEGGGGGGGRASGRLRKGGGSCSGDGQEEERGGDGAIGALMRPQNHSSGSLPLTLSILDWSVTSATLSHVFDAIVASSETQSTGGSGGLSTP